MIWHDIMWYSMRRWKGKNQICKERTADMKYHRPVYGDENGDGGGFIFNYFYIKYRHDQPLLIGTHMIKWNREIGGI